MDVILIWDVIIPLMMLCGIALMVACIYLLMPIWAAIGAIRRFMKFPPA